MELHNPAPFTVDQVVHALSVLGQEVVADPEYRPDGPTDDDLPELLGGLLGRVELEVATVVDPEDEPPQALAALLEGWRAESDDVSLHRAVLMHRLQRTAFDIGAALGEEEDDEDAEDDEPTGPPGVAGSAACALAATDLLAAQAAVDDGHIRRARRALDSVEGFLAQALLTVHLLRLEVRAEEDDDEDEEE
jgi:hypothetical protein